MVPKWKNDDRKTYESRRGTVQHSTVQEHPPVARGALWGLGVLGSWGLGVLTREAATHDYGIGRPRLSQRIDFCGQWELNAGDEREQGQQSECGRRAGESTSVVSTCARRERFHGTEESNQTEETRGAEGSGGVMGESARIGVSLPKPKIAPSMLSSDFANLASEAKLMERCGADWLHMDIMDGHFVPNLTIGAPVIKSLRQHTNAFLDCHLMVTNPSDYVEPLGKAGASSFTFHLEAAKDNWKELLRSIKTAGMQAAVALKPGTPVEEVYPLLESENGVDMVLVMTVEPGFGGQKFMSDMMPKVKDLRSKYPHLDIQVDGGMAPSTIDEAAAAGANVVVAGSSVFGNKDPASVIQLLRGSIQAAQSSF